VTDTIYAVVALVSLAGAVLAWLAKLRWSREFAAAKDEIIRVKDAHIETLNKEISGLRELTPMRIREYFVSVKEQLEEYNDLLQGQLDKAKNEVAAREAEIATLRAEGTQQTSRIQRLQRELEDISKASSQLENQLSVLRKKYESEDVIVFTLPKIDPSIFADIAKSTATLSNLAFHARIIDPEKLDTTLHDYNLFLRAASEHLVIEESKK
jgi:predicted nuclease with TOPRIM domain